MVGLPSIKSAQLDALHDTAATMASPRFFCSQPSPVNGNDWNKVDTWIIIIEMKQQKTPRQRCHLLRRLSAWLLNSSGSARKTSERVPPPSHLQPSSSASWKNVPNWWWGNDSGDPTRPCFPPWEKGIPFPGKRNKRSQKPDRPMQMTLLAVVDGGVGVGPTNQWLEKRSRGVAKVAAN